MTRNAVTAETTSMTHVSTFQRMTDAERNPCAARLRGCGSSRVCDGCGLATEPSRLFHEVILKVFDPFIAFVELGIRVHIEHFFESAAARLQVGLLRGDVRMGRQIIRLLEHLLPLFGKNKIEK